MTDHSAWLFDWFRQRAAHITLAPDDNYFNAGAIDSFGVIELIEDMERAFSVRFSQDDFQDRRFSSVAGLAALLAEKMGA
ncbi:MAG: acyl carrier protein [Pseudomonadota bacterium]|nr:acyl carrier protein [Pseudomonadota bacterium]